mmetsp:Transcript_2229/g.4908  ORF Transcript_2229/g.4908 Transcript_2229/m.4908 type:complete len:247 (-) Transcript_2229:110-850(-)
MTWSSCAGSGPTCSTRRRRAAMRATPGASPRPRPHESRGGIHCGGRKCLTRCGGRRCLTRCGGDAPAARVSVPCGSAVPCDGARCRLPQGGCDGGQMRPDRQRRMCGWSWCVRPRLPPRAAFVATCGERRRTRGWRHGGEGGPRLGPINRATRGMEERLSSPVVVLSRSDGRGVGGGGRSDDSTGKECAMGASERREAVGVLDRTVAGPGLDPPSGSGPPALGAPKTTPSRLSERLPVPVTHNGDN